jgi:hypothetical protein
MINEKEMANVIYIIDDCSSFSSMWDKHEERRSKTENVHAKNRTEGRGSTSVKCSLSSAFHRGIRK